MFKVDRLAEDTVMVQWRAGSLFKNHG